MPMFELWEVASGPDKGLSVIAVGRRGEQGRAMLSPGATVILRYEAHSTIDMMQQFYDHVCFGPYHAIWPDLDSVPFWKLWGNESLAALPRRVAPFMPFSIHADGSTSPTVLDPMPVITCQDKAIFQLGLWVQGAFGGHKESPLNEADLLPEAEALVRQSCPHVLESVDTANLVCPPALFDKMIWQAFSR
jgi:hypothetical protein